MTTDYESPKITPIDEPLVPPKGIGTPDLPPPVELSPIEAALLAVDQRIGEAAQNLDDSKPVSSDSLIQHSIASSLLAVATLARAAWLEDHSERPFPWATGDVDTNE